MAKAKRVDIYQEVTDRIIENLKDAKSWSKPWESLGNSFPHNGTSGRAYSGINAFILAMVGVQYPTPRWLTYKQARACGWNVRKGEKGTHIIWWNIIEKEKEGKIEKFPVLKTFTVFNVAQCDDLDEKKLTEYVPPVMPKQGVIELANELGIKVVYGGDRACFIPSLDQINMPSHEAFVDDDNHEATLLHEMIHWTGAKARLDRIGGHSYAEEELVAEIGAAMAGAVLGIPYEGLQHESYIASWLTKLESDPKHIFKAAKMAQKAVNMIVPAPVEVEAEAEAA